MTAAPRIAAGFARHLHSYDLAAVAQRQIADGLAAQIASVVRPGANMVELGHGSGLLTRHLLALRPQRLWLNDLSAPLPDLSWPRALPLHKLAGDAQELALPAAVDLIASSSMLQWLADPAALLRRAVAALRRGGILAVSSFGPDNFPELGRFGLTEGAPSFQSAADLRQALPPDVEILAGADAAITLQFDDAPALFAHLRATGVNGLRAGRLSAAALRRLMAEMTAQNALTLTYRPSYCMARKL